MRYDNSVGNCLTIIRELFADLFESVYNVDSDTEDVSGPSDGCGFSSTQLRISDLEAVISGFDAKKGPGNDDVPPSFVKLCANGLKSPLLSLSTGTFPSKWKKSFLIPIFKTGQRNDVGNYRDVAILSCFAKLFKVTVYDYIFFRSNFLSCLLNTGFLRAGEL
jgi:hypothetical protein